MASDTFVWDAAGRLRFRDRSAAAALLAEKLLEYRAEHPLVLGIPRGGIPVAAIVARRLDADLDVVVARKLGAPGHEELAIGAVTANGGRFLNDELIRQLRVSQTYLDRVTSEQVPEARRREERFRAGGKSFSLAGRTVIIVDDGLATGATMKAAVRSVRRHAPAKIIVAVPVGAPETCSDLRAEADEVVCLQQPEPFWAVGLFYQRFEPVEDDDVVRIMSAFRALSQQPAGGGASTSSQASVL